MRKYLSTLHQKTPEHKKRFALLTSMAFTLLIFSIWSITSFPPKADQPLAGGNQVDEVTPFESLRASVATAFKVLRSDVDNLEKGLETVNTGYGR